MLYPNWGRVGVRYEKIKRVVVRELGGFVVNGRVAFEEGEGLGMGWHGENNGKT